MKIIANYFTSNELIKLHQALIYSIKSPPSLQQTHRLVSNIESNAIKSEGSDYLDVHVCGNFKRDVSRDEL